MAEALKESGMMKKYYSGSFKRVRKDNMHLRLEVLVYDNFRNRAEYFTKLEDHVMDYYDPSEWLVKMDFYRDALLDFFLYHGSLGKVGDDAWGRSLVDVHMVLLNDVYG